MAEGDFFPIRTLVVAGLGLIGGSFAVAARSAGIAQRLVGFDHSARHRQEAEALGLVDATLADWKDLPEETDLLLLAVPVGALAEVIADLRPHLPAHTILTDAGSVKAPLVALMQQPAYQAIRFVAGHPIAGGERFGPQAARSGLFQGKRFILTPTADTDPDALQLVRAIWTRFGSEVREMDAQMHDEIFAAVSHLPHLLAYASIQAIVTSDHSEALEHSGAGLKDFSRIASSSPEMWADIFVENKESLLKRVTVFRETLDALEAAIANEDDAALRALLWQAKQDRDRWMG